jgi:small multidrug resistance family-3 protein
LNEYHQIIRHFNISGALRNWRGYLIWLWLKADKPLWYGILGGIILIAYGVMATLQTAGFGRVYATYGGIFIVMALARKVDGFKPDKWDITGALIALIGICVIMYMPRGK